ncbi:MAG: molecular chaperone IbpA [Moritella sp.]|jgi:molecular chaperone IbpA
MTTTLDFSPLYRSALGFDQFAQITEQLFANNALDNRAREARHHRAKIRDMAKPLTKAATQPLRSPQDSRYQRDNFYSRDYSYPRYNIAQTGESDYQITLALAGFSLDEIDITVTANEMTVTGKKESGKKESGQKETIKKEAVNNTTPRFLHQGINQSDFSRKFVLADHVQVQSANMEQGLLSINLTREIPVALQPRKVAIGKTGK